jgi:hypothetical protein
MNPTTVLLVSLAAVVISALDKALTEDVSILPTLTAPWRAFIAAVGGVLVGACDATVGGALFVASLVAGLSAAAPTLVRLLLVAVLPSLTERLKTAQIRAEHASRRPPPMPPLACLTFLGVALLLGGCAGSLDTARGDGLKLRLAATPSAPTVRCVSLDTAHRTWSGIAEGTAFAAGAAGISIIPIDDKTGRVLIVSAGVVLGTAAAVSVYVAGDYAAAWARECSGAQ